MFNLPIPIFEPSEQLHNELAAAAAEAAAALRDPLEQAVSAASISVIAIFTRCAAGARSSPKRVKRAGS